MDCPKCGAWNENPVGSCLSCGAQLPDEEAESLPTMMPNKVPPKAATSSGARFATGGAPPKQCPQCNTLNAAAFKFCARCGAPLGATVAPASGKSAPAAAPPAPPPAAKAAPKAAPAPAKAAPAAAAKAAPKAAPAAAKPATVPPTAAAKPSPTAPVTKPAPAAAARPAPPPPPKPTPKAAPKPAAPPRPRARVSAIARDGSRSADFVLTRDETRVGREVAEGEVKLDKDPFIAPVHATFKFEGDQLTVQDAGTPNGVFLWLKERTLSPGDELRIGRQRLRIEFIPDEPEEVAEQPLWGSPDPGYTARVTQVLEGGGDGDVYPLKTGDNLVGRGTGDVSFPGDGYVSSRHAQITIGSGTLAIKDLGSANGTFVRVSGSAPVTSGDLLLVGEQILRIDPA
ncbi:MAG: FHA domain-containing protein [Deltaproteobacteria bacterium]|nr:FHA domain-containing protein [Deltaproteobacteria bacterium]